MFRERSIIRKTTVKAILNCAIAVCIVVGGRTVGFSQAPAKRDTFLAKTVNLSIGAGQDVKIDVFRWSTDDERTRIVSALKEKSEAFVEALEKAPSLGSIWTNENLGYSIRYAYRDSLANGSERVILLTNGRFGAWSGQIWKPLHPSEADYPFSLIELRFNRSGAGEGKMSLTTKVVADDAGKTLMLADYDAAPILLRPVKRESGPSK